MYVRECLSECVCEREGVCVWVCVWKSFFEIDILVLIIANFSHVIWSGVKGVRVKNSEQQK